MDEDMREIISSLRSANQRCGKFDSFYLIQYGEMGHLAVRDAGDLLTGGDMVLAVLNNSSGIGWKDDEEIEKMVEDIVNNHERNR